MQFDNHSPSPQRLNNRLYGQKERQYNQKKENKESQKQLPIFPIQAQPINKITQYILLKRRNPVTLSTKQTLETKRSISPQEFNNNIESQVSKFRSHNYQRKKQSGELSKSLILQYQQLALRDEGKLIGFREQAIYLRYEVEKNCRKSKNKQSFEEWLKQELEDLEYTKKTIEICHKREISALKKTQRDLLIASEEFEQDFQENLQLQLISKQIDNQFNNNNGTNNKNQEQFQEDIQKQQIQ